MKILVVCQYYYPEPFRIHEVCEELVARGHEVTVLTGLPNYPMGIIPDEYKGGQRRREDINGVKVIRVNEIPRTDGKIGLAKNYVSFVCSGSLKALTMKKDFDVIFVYQLSPILMAIPAFVAKWFSKTKKLALYCLDLWPESLASLNIQKDSAFFKMIKHVSKKIYNGADVVGYTSTQFETYFREELRLKQKNYRYIPQFADALFDEVSENNSEGINFVFAGNVGKMQSVDTIIRAAALVDDANIRWHIVGDGFALDSCKELARKLGVEDRVIFYGRMPVEEMPKYYAMADAMLVTLADNKAISYTLPGKVQSYMAAGKPILASAGGETKRLIEEARCGMCAAPEDADELAKLAKEIAKANTKAMGCRSREYYREHFSKKKHVDRIEEMLNG